MRNESKHSQSPPNKEINNKLEFQKSLSPSSNHPLLSQNNYPEDSLLSPRKKSPFNNKLNRSQKKPHKNPNIVMDYLNAKYQGKMVQQTDNRVKKMFKNGPGILLDDNLNFLVSNWNKNRLTGETALINRFGNYVYGKWDENLKSPTGIIVLKIKQFHVIARFSQDTGKWNMLEGQNGKVIIIIDQQLYSVLVLEGQIQQSSSEYEISKSVPLSVVEFTNFPALTSDSQAKQQFGQSNSRIKQSARNIEQLIVFYCQKYNLKIQEHERGLSKFLSFTSQHLKSLYVDSEEFTLNVSKSLIKSLFSDSEAKRSDKQQKKSYELQKQKIQAQNCIICKRIDVQNIAKRQHLVYFGFIGGLGVKYSDNPKKNIMYKPKQRVLNLKSIGNHNQSMKIQDIGARIFDNKCIEQGNFRSKQTCTYENEMFRPSNKLSSIYSKYHKKQINFINQYFEKQHYSIFKILNQFQRFLDEHVTYIMNECFNETTKFHGRQENNELIEKLWSHPSKRLPFQEKILNISSRLCSPNYQLHIQIKQTSNSKSLNQKNRDKPLNALKNKNSELKQKIKKVKYQIQYHGTLGTQNKVFISDNKFMSKIKKHLCQTNLQSKLSNAKHVDKQRSTKNETKGKALISKNETSDKSLISKNETSGKTLMSKKSKQRTNYIKRQKQKILSPQKSFNHDDSLQRIDNYFVRRTNLNLKQQQKPRTEEQKALQRINKSILFKQKFNYGIEYNVENDNLKNSKKQEHKYPQKNKYNGRQRVFTDNQLDQVIDKQTYLPQKFSPRSITPGRRIKKKQQYRHYIHSNKKKDQNMEQTNLTTQKRVQEQIRAQILGISLQDYLKNLQSEKEKQKMFENKLYQIFGQRPSLDKANVQFFNADQTFGVVQKQYSLKQSSIEKGQRSNRASFSRSISRISHQQMEGSATFRQSGALVGKSKNAETSFISDFRQESLIEKRMRILQQFKNLNLQAQQEQSHERTAFQNYAPQQRTRRGNKAENRLSIEQLCRRDKHLERVKHLQRERVSVYEYQPNRNLKSPLKSQLLSFEERIDSGRKFSPTSICNTKNINRRQVSPNYFQNQNGLCVTKNQKKGEISVKKYNYYFNE